MNRKQISIHIGEYYTSREPVVIHTVLGSCVAACLYDLNYGVGGMNHILLPGRADLKKFDSSARYGINAMEILINRMMTLGADRKHLRAKVFGGAHMIAGISRENGVGEKISSFVLEFLKMEGIRVVNKDVGGTDARRILFYTDTGDVFLKRIPSSSMLRIVEKEVREAGKIRQITGRPGEVELFDQ